MIIESGIVNSTTTDLLSGGRLNNIPYNGVLTIQLQSDKNDATDNIAVTVQKPNGDVPVDQQRLTGSNPALAGVLDSRQYLELSFQATQGGHFTIGLQQTGSAIATWRAVLKP